MSEIAKTSAMALRLKQALRTRLARKTLPDFVILGAQKAGTTSLYSYLARHPYVAPASSKEVHYFDLNYFRGREWYRQHFPVRHARWLYRLAGRRAFVTGEASPYYLFHPAVPQRIRDTLPRAKLIVLLRNPVDRTISNYHYSVRGGAEKLPLHEALAAEQSRLVGEVDKLMRDARYHSFSHVTFSYVGRSLYAGQIARWFDWFKRSQFLFLKSEDLFRRPAVAVREVTDFLELPTFDFGSEFPVENCNTYAAAPPGIYAALTEFFRPHNRRLYDLLGRDFGWEAESIEQARHAA